MKRSLSFIFTLLLLLMFSVSVNASHPQVADHADLLSSQEETILEAKAAQLSDTYQMDVVIVTTHSLNSKSSETFADDYYDQNSYGIGPDKSGTLLLLSMEHRDWAISTCGEAIYALTDYDIQSLFSSISDDLSKGAYFEAFSSYLDALCSLYDTYRNGKLFDGISDDYHGPGTYIPGTQEDIYYYENTAVKDFGWYLRKFFLSLAIGAVTGGVALLIMRSRMNTARLQKDASSYLGGGSAKITQHRDLFLYSHVSKTKKPEQSSGGGSSIHRSSSGRHHGGGHGKF